MNFEIALIMLPGLVLGITVHEFAHAWSASLLGDNLARRQGRVSLNPFRHMTLLGTLAIFLLPIGWGRPVQVNLYNFRHPKRDYLLTSLAGPISNLLLAAVLIGLLQLTRHAYAFGEATSYFLPLVHLVLTLGVLINVSLAVLNLLPIPPLDGSKIWPCLIPSLKPTYTVRTNLIFFVILIVLMSTHSLNAVLEWPISTAMKLLPESDYALVGQKESVEQGATSQPDAATPKP